MRDVPNEGHPGAMLSLSANGGRNGILWASIHATGDSWHESRPGVLHAYDADDIRRELWNSLAVPARDDCGEYSKMAPPTIANGHVYLASFGTENVGTGQLCLYGLLPVAEKKPPTPRGARADVARGNVPLTWDPMPGAVFYRVARSSSQEPDWKTVGTGLPMPKSTEPAPERGELVTYTVLAVDHEGVSAASDPGRLPLRKAMPVEQ